MKISNFYLFSTSSSLICEVTAFAAARPYPDLALIDARMLLIVQNFLADNIII